MDYAALFRSAMVALLRNKMRSILTVLGITIGIAALILYFAVRYRRRNPLEIGVDIFAFFGEVEVGGNVIAAARQLGVVGENLLQALFFAHHLLGSQRIRPQIGVGGLLFDFG